MSHGSVDLWKQNIIHTCMWIKTWQPHRRQRYSCALQNISSKHCTTCRSHCLSGAAPATKSAATVANEKFGPASTDRRASRGVILKGREVRGFLNDGMAGLYEVKREPCHMVEHLFKLASLIHSSPSHLLPHLLPRTSVWSHSDWQDKQFEEVVTNECTSWLGVTFSKRKL